MLVNVIQLRSVSSDAGHPVIAHDDPRRLHETGLNGVAVTLEITYPDGTVTTLTTVTENDSSGNPGWYSFPNLLQDEDYNGDTATTPEPTFTISVDETQAALNGYSPTTADVNGNGNDLEDSENFAGVPA